MVKWLTNQQLTTLVVILILFFVINSIFITSKNLQLKLELERRPKVTTNFVFDIGFNDGRDTAFYMQAGFNVIAIEADPELYGKGREKFAKEIAEKRLVLLNIGIAQTAGSGLQFYKHKFNSYVLLILCTNSRIQRMEFVHTERRLPKCLRRMELSLLHTDNCANYDVR
jgi:FkbM family methyltransferase